MGFGDIANRFRKQADVQVAHIVDYDELYRLRARIVGVLLRGARVTKGFTVDHLAQQINAVSDEVVAWEFGNETPSLPQLEVLAYTLEVPISHFLEGTETLMDKLGQRMIDQGEYIQTRDHMIGTMIRLRRDEIAFTADYLAEQTGLPTDLLLEYEYGRRAIPLTHLTSIASALRVNLSSFLENTNRVGSYLEAQEMFDIFLQMDPETRQFLTKPSNHRYIELAMKLANMGSDKLRSIAENILEITY